MAFVPKFLVPIDIFYLLLALAARVVLCGLAGSCDPDLLLVERVDTVCEHLSYLYYA